MAGPRRCASTPGPTLYPLRHTTYTYDALGDLVQVTDAASNITGMAYDPLGRKMAMTDPDMGSWSYGYDAAGNLTPQRDGRNQWLYFEMTSQPAESLPGQRQRDCWPEYQFDAMGRREFLAQQGIHRRRRG
ncbi:MAG: RHS repeat protein [Anaerolineales bacterium]|nr:RHS repeat protein [Anaerolineales bacterium]